jgi:Tfp pilus assembly protein PilO
MPSSSDNSQTASRKGPQVLGRDLYQYRVWVRAGLLGLLLIDGLFFFFSFRPMGTSFTQQNEDLKALREDAKNKREIVDKLRKTESTLTESSRLGEQFYERRFLPAETGFGTIMEEVDRLANSNGVHKGAVSYGLSQVKDRPDLERISIDTVVEGEYSKIVRFVNQLEQSHLFLIVDSLGVSSGKGKTVTVSVKVITLFRAPKGLAPVEAHTPAPEAHTL